MIDKLAHAVMPVAVVVASTVLVAMRRIDSTTGVALISAAAGFGALAISKQAPK